MRANRVAARIQGCLSRRVRPADASIAAMPMTRARSAMPVRARLSHISIIIIRHAIDVNPFKVSATR